MYILGISGLYHDSAAALLSDTTILAAAQEERFTRIKQDNRLPVHAIEYCLNEAGIHIWDVDKVVYYDNPMLTLDRYLHNLEALDNEQVKYLIEHKSQNVFSQRLKVDQLIKEHFGLIGKENKLHICEHHISHAASAFYPSPFEHAAILTVDGVGEWATTTIGRGSKEKIEILQEIDYPHSLGLLYSTFTSFCGFKVNFGDYKFMGLAPYGEPVYYSLIKDTLIDVKEDGSFCLNLDYFSYYKDAYMYNDKMCQLFGGLARQPEGKITKREMNIAASVQKLTEEIILKLARHAKQITGENNLVMAGGVALNCVANGKLMQQHIFDHIWIQPAAGDAGGALGCAYYTAYNLCGLNRTVSAGDSQQGSYLGPQYSNEEIKNYLDVHNYPYEEKSEDILYTDIADLIARENIVGWFQGRMEYGPRALGNRSILGDARSSKMQSILNLKIKYRESFRPFAPAVLLEDAEKYFELKCASPYMLLCANVQKNRRKLFSRDVLLKNYNEDMLPIVNAVRSDIPAVTHVDYSARVQTVSEDKNKRFYKLLTAFKKLTKCSVLVNTSFNVRGEPIVCSPEDAYKCFMRTEMDVLVLGNFVLYKDQQTPIDKGDDWRNQYALD